MTNDFVGMDRHRIGHEIALVVLLPSVDSRQVADLCGVM